MSVINPATLLSICAESQAFQSHQRNFKWCIDNASNRAFFEGKNINGMKDWAGWTLYLTSIEIYLEYRESGEYVIRAKSSNPVTSDIAITYKINGEQQSAFYIYKENVNGSSSSKPATSQPILSNVDIMPTLDYKYRYEFTVKEPVVIKERNSIQITYNYITYGLYEIKATARAAVKSNISINLSVNGTDKSMDITYNSTSAVISVSSNSTPSVELISYSPHEDSFYIYSVNVEQSSKPQIDIRVMVRIDIQGYAHINARVTNIPQIPVASSIIIDLESTFISIKKGKTSSGEFTIFNPGTLRLKDWEPKEDDEYIYNVSMF